MRKISLCVLILLLLTSLSITANNDEPTIKWGKIDLKHLKMTHYEADPNADAVILFDYGHADMLLEGGQLKRVTTHHRRIKILSKNAYDLGNITINRLKEQELSGFKAAIYSPKGNGTASHKVDKKDMTQENIDKKEFSHKISLPGLSEGCIIEIYYTLITSNTTTIPTWYFQSTLPMLWSEYTVLIRNKIDYVNMFNGMHPLHKKEVKGNSERWMVKDIPALRAEPYMTILEDYYTHINFQISAIHIPGYTHTNVLEDWPAFNRKMLDEIASFSLYDMNNITDGVLNKIKNSGKSTKDQMIATYNLFRNEMAWDGTYEKFSDSPYPEIFKKKEGTSADINYMLMFALRYLDIEAHPVFVSTRSHGKAQTIYPLVSQFNHVIIYVELGEEQFLIDAIDKLRPYNLLAYDDLNEMGFLIHRKKSDWLSVASNNKYKQKISASFTLQNDGTLSGATRYTNRGYAALAERKDLQNSDNEQAYINELLATKSNDISLDSFSIKHTKELNKPLNTSCFFSTNEFSSTAKEHLYVYPMLNEKMTENPFSSDIRYFPVDFAYLYDVNYTLSLQLPDNYTVEELPENAQIKMANNEVSFTYVIQQKDNTLQVLSRYKVNTPTIAAENYTELKELFDLMINKHGEPIVLKKTN